MANRGRPPRLEPHVGRSEPAPPPTAEQLLERAKVAGTAAAPGRTELRSRIERIVAGDRNALGELAPIPGLTMVDAWAAITETFGATPERPFLDPALTLAAAARAAARIAEVAAHGGRVAIACAAPASLLGVHLAVAAGAREAGAEVPDLEDVGPLRADGRAARFLRWIDGVAAVTDGRGWCATTGGDAAREWLFVLGRPGLVVADGPFAEAAWEAGLEVIALAGLDRCGLALAAARRQRCVLVPLRTDRPPRAYGPISTRLNPARSGGFSPELRRLTLNGS